MGCGSPSRPAQSSALWQEGRYAWSLQTHRLMPTRGLQTTRLLKLPDMFCCLLQTVEVFLLSAHTRKEQKGQFSITDDNTDESHINTKESTLILPKQDELLKTAEWLSKQSCWAGGTPKPPRPVLRKVAGFNLTWARVK